MSLRSQQRLSKNVVEHNWKRTEHVDGKCQQREARRMEEGRLRGGKIAVPSRGWRPDGSKGHGGASQPAHDMAWYGMLESGLGFKMASLPWVKNRCATRLAHAVDLSFLFPEVDSCRA